jgi:molybdopterin synthase sulfur carrier subunit
LSILVKYFASVSDLVGKAGESVEAANIRTANDVWVRATDEAIPANLLVAINQEHARIEDTVNDGDEVAFFPPVTGG